MWHYTITRNRIFEICSWFTLVTIAVDVLGFVVGETLQEPIYFKHLGWLGGIAVAGIFLILAICVFSQIFLWLGMIAWSAVWPGEWIVLRGLLVAAQLLTLSFGSSLIYVFVYRKQHERAQQSMMARAGVSA